MLSMFKTMNANKQHLREFDPATRQRIKEGAYLVKMITETQVAARKCELFAGNAIDEEVSNAFAEEAKILRQSANIMQQYYESMTME